MTQSGALTRKIKGEWVDKQKKDLAQTLVGVEKFNIFQRNPQNFESIKEISPIFLRRNSKNIFKIANIQKFKMKKNGDNYLLENFTAKDDIFDNYEDTDKNQYKSEDIFIAISQTLNQKEASENSLYKKTSYKLKDEFYFAFHLECDFELRNSVVTLGADRSSFKMEVKQVDEPLIFSSNYLVLLSDSYISIPLKGNCDFAITSEISYQNLTQMKGVQKDKQTNKNSFSKNGKSKKVYLYEKGSVIINPSKELIENLNNENLQQIGYNIYTKGNK